MGLLKEKLKEYHGGKILDVATGYGDFLKLLTESFRDYSEAVGIDTDRERVEAARKSSENNLRFVVMNAGRTDFDEDHFDTVAIRHSLHHLKNPAAVLDEMKRILIPGGLFVVGEVFRGTGIPPANAQMHVHHWWAEVDRALGKFHAETYTREQVLDLVDSVKLNIVDTFEILDEYDADEETEIVESMIKSIHEYIARLEAAGDFPNIVDRGKALIATYQEQGFVDDSTVYVIGRK